jgi:tetratricopeptide (TPR) repeat protein
LSRIAGLRVAGNASTARFRGATPDPREIGAQLNVAALLRGSVRRERDRFGVNVQLIATATGYQLWSANFEGSGEDLFVLQDRIAAQVARSLEVRLAARTEPDSVRYSPQRLEAHRLSVRGREIQRAYNPATLPEAIRLYEAAVQADPTYALAHSGLAHTLLSYYDFEPEHVRTSAARIFAEAKRALQLDPHLADAHAALVRYYRDVELDLHSARTACDSALRELPNAAGLLGNCGLVFDLLGQSERALRDAERAVAINPLWETGHSLLANSYYRAGRFEDALREARRAHEISPDSVLAFRLIALCQVEQGQLDAALASVSEGDRSGSEEPEAWIALRGLIQARQGLRSEAKARLAELALRRRVRRVCPIYDSWVFLGLDDRAQAAAAIRAAIQQKHPAVNFYLRDRLMLPLWQDPRYRPLLQGVYDVRAGSGGGHPDRN